MAPPVVLSFAIFSLLPLFFFCHRAHRDLHSFPTRRSSDLCSGWRPRSVRLVWRLLRLGGHRLLQRRVELHPQDRKSTRLNSSHTVISYAVFCLKKKKGRSFKSFLRR